MTAWLLAAAAALIAAAAATRFRIRKPYQGRHAPASFADPADVADPDGSQFVKAISAELPPEMQDTVSCPAPGLAVLERVHASLLALPPAADPVMIMAAVTGPAFTPFPDIPDAPDATVTQLHAVCTWGGTAQQVADQLAAEHLAVTS